MDLISLVVELEGEQLKIWACFFLYETIMEKNL